MAHGCNTDCWFSYCFFDSLINSVYAKNQILLPVIESSIMNIINKIMGYLAGREVNKFKKNEEIKENKYISEEMKKLEEFHCLQCPNCGMHLNEIDHKNIRINKCPQCSGLWFDAGKHESILQLEKNEIENIYHTLIKQFY